MPAPPCQPGCDCRKHHRTKEHNDLIRAGIKRAQWDNLHSGRPINQHPVRGPRG